MGTISEQAAILRKQWEADPRWTGIERTYRAEDVIRLRGSVAEEHTLAWLGATRLWDLLHRQDADGGGQAMRMTAAGPRAVRRINTEMLRADSAACSERSALAPVVADADAGSSGVLNAFDLMTAMIEAGAAGVHFEDRLPTASGGTVLIPTGQHIKTLNAARLAADVLNVPALVIARTAGVGRGLEFAPYADVLWLQAPAPDLAEARAFAHVIHSRYPGKTLVYGCPPSRDWPADLDVAACRRDLAAMGYRFQLVTPAGARPARRRREADIRYFDHVTRAIDPEEGAEPPAAALEPADFVGDDLLDAHGRLVPAD